jgi:tRNA threonylcarbamoyladenosine biosynthesis protein TsaB
MSLPRLTLALETSTPYGSVAVGEDGSVLAEFSVRVGTGHSAHLVPLVDEVLRRVDAGPRDVAEVLVGAGPGSFTGVRIGAATAKGIVASLGVPLRPFSTLLALAAGCAHADRPVCAVMDARHRDVFTAVYRFAAGVETLREPRAATLDDLIGWMDEAEAPLLVGDGALRHRDELLERLPHARVAGDHLAFPRAGSLLWLARAAPHLAAATDGAAWEPEYLRASGAERIAAAREAGRADG